MMYFLTMGIPQLQGPISRQTLEPASSLPQSLDITTFVSMQDSRTAATPMMSPSPLDPNNMRLPLVMPTLEIGDPQGLASST